VILPLALFVVLVGGIAWVSQYLPSWKERKQPPPPTESPVRFTRVTTSEESPNYYREFEYGVEGHLDYLFQNTSDKAVELGALWKQCSCSRLDIGLLTPAEARPLLELDKQGSPDKLLQARAGLERLTAGLEGRWKAMNLSEDEGVNVPAGGAGVLRIIWRRRVAEQEVFEIKAIVWARPAGTALSERLALPIKPRVSLVPPVRLYPDKADVGKLYAKSSETKKFLYWSATRDKVEVTPADDPDPLVKCEVLPLRPDEFEGAQKRLEIAGHHTRIRSGCWVRVTLHEEKDGKQLDMGALVRPVKVRVKADGEAMEVANPVLIGRVRSDVRLISADDQEQINLGGFKARDGTAHTARLVARPEVKLKLAGDQPAFLKLKLTRKEEADSETTWELDVTVPPRALPGGHLPPETSVVLLSTSPEHPARRIRIHVTGTAARD
jgi:hypothetical protein